MDQHTSLIWDHSFADPRYFSDINVLLSFALSFSSLCSLVSKGGCSLICLINHLWHSARSLIHSNLSVACNKLSSPPCKRGLGLWHCDLQPSLGALFSLFSVFRVDSSSYRGLSTSITAVWQDERTSALSMTDRNFHSLMWWHWLIKML